MASPAEQEATELIENVAPPPEELTCSICLQVLCDPTLTSCCGQHFCRGCIDRVMASGHVCPLCNEKGFQTFLDKATLRKVREMKVYCKLKAQGCGWVGELAALERHLDVANGDCEFVEVECEFGVIGCVEKMPRKNRDSHSRECMHKHLLLMALKNQQFEKQIAELQKQIAELQKSVKRADITMTNFAVHKKYSERWYSPPFLSHPGGYKMCLRVCANGDGTGKGTHLSVHVTLMRGEFDDQLQWPFRGTITVQLLNQRGDGEEGHVVDTIPFDDRTPDSAAGRVVGHEMTPSSYGYRKFTTHSNLAYNATKNTEYLLNDCLRFRVSNIKLSHPACT